MKGETDGNSQVQLSKIHWQFFLKNSIIVKDVEVIQIFFSIFVYMFNTF